MKKKYLGLLLTAGLLAGVLWGCGGEVDPETVPQPDETLETTATTVHATVPPDGKADDVTCKGSYTAEMNADAVVASVGDARLTNEQLQVYYWAEVAAYRQADQEIAPDFAQPLDTQACALDSSVASWQQYFLRRALNTWHSAQALVLQGQDEGLPTEEAYQPDLEKHEEYIADKPAAKYLYGNSASYQPNTMHQEYLDNIPATLEALAEETGYADASAMAREAFGTSVEALADVTELYNRGYMYFTSLGYYIEVAQEEVEAYFTEWEEAYTQAGITRDSGSYVDIRHILLVPEQTDSDGENLVSVAADGTVTCSEEAWEACRKSAEALLASWRSGRKVTDATFGELAYKNSDDPGSAVNGGAYRQLKKGQLMPQLDEWCFDDNRQSGDITILRSDYGYHILYFTGSTDIWYAEAEKDLIAQRQVELIATAREKYPAQIDYSVITLAEAGGMVSAGDVLYPDVAHERFPEVPLYLQQDYPTTMYGRYPIRTHGCGITALAMLASYMTDDELTPPELCARYASYSHVNGTDGMIFIYEPPVLGFYLKERTYNCAVAEAALKEGYIVVALQRKGYWTSGGHYILLEEETEDGRIRVRDSNLYSYLKLSGWENDLFPWSTIPPGANGFWIFENKVTRIPACIRCGEPEGVVESLLQEDFYCEKCRSAMLRRGTYLTACGD